MDTKILPSEIKRLMMGSLSVIEGILPFTEKPCNGQFEQKEEDGKKEINASDLFSFFTANIIKQEVIFTR